MRGARIAWATVARPVAVALLALASLGLSAADVAASLWSDAPDYTAIRAGAVVADAGGDPYDQAAIARIEARDGQGGAALPYVYPPTVTALQLPFARLPYGTALHLWAVLLGIAALGTVVLVLRAVWRGRLGVVPVVVALALGLAFAPMHRGLQLGQVDPLLALPAAGGLLLAIRGRDGPGGVALSALLLKPQLAAFPLGAVLVSGRARMVAGVVAGVGVQAAAVAVLDVAGFHLDPGGLLHAVRAGDPHRPLVVATEVVALAVTVVAVLVRRPIASARDRAEALLIVVSLGTVLTAIVGPWVKLNPQSDVLLVIAAAVVARDVWGAVGAGSLSRARTVVAGCAFGALLGDTLFAVAHYDGYGDAVLAVATVVLALAAVAVARPRLAPACAVAGVVNLALTLPMIPPGYDGVVSAAAAMLLALLICRPAVVARGALWSAPRAATARLDTLPGHGDEAGRRHGGRRRRRSPASG